MRRRITNGLRSASCPGTVLPDAQASSYPRGENLGFLAIFHWSVRDNLITGDTGLANLFGVDETALTQGLPIQVFLSAIHPEDVSEVGNRIATACEQRSVYFASYRVRENESNWRQVTAIGKCITDANGSPQFSGAILEPSSLPDDPPLAISLPPREIQCLDWCSQGKTNWEIGRILGISERTVEHHIASAMRRLGAASRVQGVALALKLGLIS